MTSSSTPELPATFTVPQSQIDELALLGHTVVRGLASPEEAAEFRPAIESAVQRATGHVRPIESRDTYGKAFLQVPNLCFSDDVARAFTFAPRFARVAAELLQVGGVRLYHDQALFKEPGGGYTPWHQDQVYWPLDNDKCVTMWMPLVDVPSAVGSMTFADGSHLRGDLGRGIIGDESEAGFATLVRDHDLPTRTHGAMRAGDATFHMGWTLHRADPNPTDLLRSVMTVIYIADGTRVGEIDSPARQLDQAIWLGGARPGSLVDGPGNPLLWPVDE
jgi:ectoine hydroxylase-related dioxygenase (phytanoyl-CoA dioxygenase family)